MLSQLKINLNKLDGVAQKVNLIRQYIEENKNPRVHALIHVLRNKLKVIDYEIKKCFKLPEILHGS